MPRYKLFALKSMSHRGYMHRRLNLRGFQKRDEIKNDHKDEYNRPLKPAKSLKPLKNLQTPLSITFLLRNRRNFRVFEIMKVANFIQYEK